MAVFALIHGSGDGGWSWHLVERALRELGHEAVAPELPTDREDATWDDCVRAVVDAVGDADRVVVVGHSSGGFVVPLVADRVGAALQVFVAGLVPRPGESATEWFDDVGWFAAGAGDPVADFFHDVPPGLAREAMARDRPTSEQLALTPWPGDVLPGIPARYVVTCRDRFIPAEVQRRVAAERLGIALPDEIEAGHCVALGRPGGLADLLASYV